MPNFLPCPFCAGAAEARNFSHSWYIECQDCHATTDGKTTLEAAAALWNRRATHPFTVLRS